MRFVRHELLVDMMHEVPERVHAAVASMTTYRHCRRDRERWVLVDDVDRHGRSRWRRLDLPVLQGRAGDDLGARVAAAIIDDLSSERDRRLGSARAASFVGRALDLGKVDAVASEEDVRKAFELWRQATAT